MVLCCKPAARRSGLTLMELVVVLVILVALAGILVPILPSMIERAHRSTQATNTSEVTKAIQLYQSLNGTYPDGYDLMTDGSNLINYFPSCGAASPMPLGETANPNPTNYLGFSYPAGGYVSAAPLSSNALSALQGAGIVNEYALMQYTSSGTNSSSGTEPWQPTFNPYPSGAPITTPLSTSTAVVYVNGSGVLQAGLGNPSIINAKRLDAICHARPRQTLERYRHGHGQCTEQLPQRYRPRESQSGL